MSDDPPVLEVTGLEKYFPQRTSILDTILRRRGDPVAAVDGVSLTLDENDAQGLIGESGCGKSTLLKTLIGLHDPTGGTIRYKGWDLAAFDRGDWKDFRSDVQIIFQNPFDSLDPKMTVRESLLEPLKTHNMGDRDARVREALERAELQPVDKYLDRLPSQLSGGEKQRVSIARALVVDPEVILADEPVSMLDVSTQASILRLLDDLVEEVGISMLYISHDISTVAYVCSQLHVMYLGRIVESAPVGTVLDDPKHPYTQALIGAIPVPDPHADRERTTMEGAPQDPIGMGTGCRFRDRCPDRMDVCEQTPRTVGCGQDHEVACHLYYDHESVARDAADGTPQSRALASDEGGD